MDIRQDSHLNERRLDPRPATDVYAYNNSVCIKQVSLENEKKMEQLVYFDVSDIPVIVKWLTEVATEIEQHTPTEQLRNT